MINREIISDFFKIHKNTQEYTVWSERGNLNAKPSGT